MEFVLEQWYESLPLGSVRRRARLRSLYYDLERDYELRQETDDEEEKEEEEEEEEEKKAKANARHNHSE